MIWSLSWRADPVAASIADRHYNRQKVGAAQFVPPGRCLVLLAEPPDRALWVTPWPFGEYVKHRWPGAWVCSCYRREGGPTLASEAIRQAVAATRWRWPDVPERGMVTFIDREKVRPTMVRGVPTWGWTYLRAGFEPDGETEGGLLAFRCSPENMPTAERPIGASGDLFAMACAS